jgi:alkylation response protein AidB-like acyl-CoA dehydrogenase
MARLAQTPGLSDGQRSMLDTVRQFVDKEIIPHAQRLEHADEYRPTWSPACARWGSSG